MEIWTATSFYEIQTLHSKIYRQDSTSNNHSLKFVLRLFSMMQRVLDVSA